jgi:transposase-like protein
MPEFARVGDFCPNESCDEYGKRQAQGQKNIVKFGKTKAGRQRYKCKTWTRTFTETKGTLFYRRRTAEDEIIATLACLAEGSRISSLIRVKGHKEDTILAWLQDAAGHAEAIEEELMAKHRIERGQLDSLWAYIGNKGEKSLPGNRRKRPVLASHDDRYGHPSARGAGHCQNGMEASREVFETLKRRGRPDAPPPTVSDGWGGMDEAMVEVYGVVPEYQGVGRPPTRKQPQPGWQLKSGPTAQDITPGGQCFPSALATAFACHGS